MNECKYLKATAGYFMIVTYKTITFRLKMMKPDLRYIYLCYFEGE